MFKGREGFSLGPRIRTEGQTSSSWQKGGSHFLVLHCLWLFLPSSLRPNQVPHVVILIFFFLEINFYMLPLVWRRDFWGHGVCVQFRHRGFDFHSKINDSISGYFVLFFDLMQALFIYLFIFLKGTTKREEYFSTFLNIITDYSNVIVWLVSS